MFDTDNCSTDYLSVALAFGRVLTTDLSPEDLGAMKDVEFLCPIDLNFMRDVGTIDNGSMIPEPWLDKVSALVEIGVLMHVKGYMFILDDLSQIKS